MDGEKLLGDGGASMWWQMPRRCHMNVKEGPRYGPLLPLGYLPVSFSLNESLE